MVLEAVVKVVAAAAKSVTGVEAVLLLFVCLFVVFVVVFVFAAFIFWHFLL